MESLFLLSTPSQAFFLSHTPELVNDSILVITAKNKEEVQGILDHVKDLKWKKVHVWFVLKSSKKMDYGNLLKIRLKILRFRYLYESFEKIYIGSYTNIIHLSIVGEYERQVKVSLLYDGLQMISVNAQRNKGKGGKIRLFPKLYTLLGFKRPVINELNYISPVSLQVTGNDSFRLIKDGAPLKEKSYRKDLIYFIGQPLSIINLISVEYYLQSLQNFKNNYSKYEIIYFPHPREDQKVLQGIAEIFEIKYLDVVFEKYFLTSIIFAGTVVSFYSSVLVNLIFFKAETKIIALKIEVDELNIHGEDISAVYSYFHKIPNPNFEIVQIENL